MKIAYSLVLFKNINSDDVDKAACDKFKLVCPNCHETLFVVTRVVNNHSVNYFAHFKRKNKKETSQCEFRVKQIIEATTSENEEKEHDYILINEGVNKVILVGWCREEPITRRSPAGDMQTVVNIATSSDGSKTEWHRVVFNGSLSSGAEISIKSGLLVFIEGKLKTRTWNTGKGEVRTITEIVALNFICF